MPNLLSRDQYGGYRHPFLVGTHYLGGVGDNPRTLAEMAMCQLSAETRRMKDWWKLFRYQNVRENWTEEALKRLWKVRTTSSHVETQLSRKQIDYVFDELSGYAALRDEKYRCQVSCFERIWESDSLLDSPILGSLNEEFQNLRELQASGRNRNEDGVTTALIDPYLHCLVYHRTLVSCGPPKPQSPPPMTDNYTVSQRFSLLPTDVSVSQSGAVQFLSYINNLHPRHTSLYQLLETTLTAFVPLFEHTLTDLHRNNPLTQRIPGPCRYTVWDEPDPPEFSDDEEGWSTYEHDMRDWIMNRPIHLPDVPDSGYPGDLERRKHTVNLRGRNLQIIVDLSETRLQPGGPGYPGSPWHVEGMRNERIVACGFYYTSVNPKENIVEHSIQFRMAVTSPRGFNAGDTGATLRTWGLHDGDSCHQYIGSVPIRAGLGIVFPNVYQHRYSPFQPDDPSKEAYLAVLSFFLVDPDIQPVISTSDVAPQQKEWIRTAVDEYVDSRLPVEIIEKIMEDVEGPMTENEAIEFRREMLAERAIFWERNDNYHFCIPFDIWNGPEFAQ